MKLNRCISDSRTDKRWVYSFRTHV